jgi:hypothetical protein
MSDAAAVDAAVDRILDHTAAARGRARFTVVCPVYNRRRALPRALESMRAQSYEDWSCLILDDGSTDGSSRIGQTYARTDPRFLYVRFEENRGGVMMNEIGMRVACELGTYWSRLGSDDWFEPHKLMVDVVTLEWNGVPACFGPYRCTTEHVIDRLPPRLPEPGRTVVTWAQAAVRSEAVRTLRQRFGGRHERLQGSPTDARSALLSGRFAMSWANAAVATEVLRAVWRRFGGFCDLRIRNMEDFHCNARIASVSSIAWRGLKQDRRTVVIGAQSWTEAGNEHEFIHDGFWCDARDGASNQRDQFARDTSVTLAAIRTDLAEHPPEDRPPVPPRVVRL